MHLGGELPDEGYIFYTNNFFTNITLSINLLKRKTYLVGMLPKNENGLRKESLDHKLEIKELCGMESSDGIAS